jgi:hypothetical protein
MFIYVISASIMTQLPDPISPEREQLYLNRAEQVINEATDPVIEELGKKMVAAAENMNQVDAAAPLVSKGAEAYIRDHDLHDLFMKTVEHPTRVAVQDAEAILAVDEATKAYSAKAYQAQADSYHALKHKLPGQQPPEVS